MDQVPSPTKHLQYLSRQWSFPSWVTKSRWQHVPCYEKALHLCGFLPSDLEPQCNHENTTRQIQTELQNAWPLLWETQGHQKWGKSETPSQPRGGSRNMRTKHSGVSWVGSQTRKKTTVQKPWNLTPELDWQQYLMLVSFLCFCFFCLFRSASVVYGGSQARGQIRATAAGLHHSNARSEPCLQPNHSSWQCWILNPLGQRLNPCPHGY